MSGTNLLSPQEVEIFQKQLRVVADASTTPLEVRSGCCYLAGNLSTKTTLQSWRQYCKEVQSLLEKHPEISASNVAPILKNIQDTIQRAEFVGTHPTQVWAPLLEQEQTRGEASQAQASSAYRSAKPKY